MPGFQLPTTGPEHEFLSLTNVRSGGVEIQRVQISLECSGAQAAEEREANSSGFSDAAKWPPSDIMSPSNLG